jgi:hypothetical protein
VKRHPLTIAGVALVTLSAVVILFALLLDMFGLHTNPNPGIVLFPIVPAFFVPGLLMIPAGLYLERCRRAWARAAAAGGGGNPAATQRMLRIKTAMGMARPLLGTSMVTHMRLKLIVMSLLVAFAAPWSAICLAGAPAHRMACCASSQSEPMVRPCCAMDADRDGVTMPPAAPSIAPLPPLSVVVAPVETSRFHCGALRARASHPIEIRLLTSVYLI